MTLLIENQINDLNSATQQKNLITSNSNLKLYMNCYLYS